MSSKLLIQLRNRIYQNIITDLIQIDQSIGSIELQNILEATQITNKKCMFFIGTHHITDSLSKLSELINLDYEKIIVIDYIDSSEIIEDSKIVLEEYVEQIVVFEEDIYILVYGGYLLKLLYNENKVEKFSDGISKIMSGGRILAVKNNCVIDVMNWKVLKDNERDGLEIIEFSVSEYGYAVAYSDNTIVIYDFDGIVVDIVQCGECCRNIKLGEINYKNDNKNKESKQKLWWINNLDLLLEYDITKKKIKQKFTNTVLVNFCVSENSIYACTSENKIVEILKKDMITHEVSVRLVDILESINNMLLMFTQFEVLTYDCKKSMEMNCLRIKEQIISYAIFKNKLLIGAENVIYTFNLSKLVNKNSK